MRRSSFSPCRMRQSGPAVRRSLMLSFSLLTFSGQALLLGGCATSALRDAPQSPDQPWHAEVDEHNRLSLDKSPHKTSSASLAMPPGYALPAATLPKEAPNASLQADHSYTLPELIDIAQSTNPATRQAWDAARNVALASGITRSLYLPQLAATVVGGYSHMKQNHSGDTLVKRGGADNDGELQSVSLNWLLFDFGKKQALMEATRLDTLASDITFTAAHQKVIYDVALAYYLYVAAQKHTKLVAQALDNARRIDRAAKANLQHGQGTVIDVAQAEQQVAQMRMKQVQTEGETQDRYLALMTAMGLQPSTKISLSLDEGHTPTNADLQTSDQLVQQAIARRPDVQAAYARARSAESQIKAARAEFLPKIFVSGNATYSFGQLGLTGLPGIGSNSSPSLNIGNSNFSGLILGGITVPIYDGGMRLAQLRQAQNSADSARQQLRHLQDMSMREIVSAQNGMHTGLSMLEAARAYVRTARTGFEAAFAAYQSGDGTVTRMLELQNGLFNATMAQSDSYYATLMAAATLAFSTGALGQADDVPGVKAPTGYMPTGSRLEDDGSSETVPPTGLAMPPSHAAMYPGAP